MATCNKCQRSHFGMLELKGGLCKSCREAMSDTIASKQAIASDPDFRSKAEKVLLTTETHVELDIKERLEIITAECAFGMHIFKDMFASIRDIVGGRSATVQQTLRDSRQAALFELKKEAVMVGGNAVIGVDLDYVELSSAGSMILLVASGTAVRI